MENNELKHYGVPGMRWGRRKGSSSTSSGSGKKTKQKKQKKELSELDKYKRSQRIKGAVKTGLGIGAVSALAIGGAKVIRTGAEIVDNLLFHL